MTLVFLWHLDSLGCERKVCWVLRLRASLVTQALIAHGLAQDSPIWYEPRVSHAHVIINFENLLVGAHQFQLGSVERAEHDMCIALHQNLVCEHQF